MLCKQTAEKMCSKYITKRDTGCLAWLIQHIKINNVNRIFLLVNFKLLFENPLAFDTKKKLLTLNVDGKVWSKFWWSKSGPIPKHKGNGYSSGTTPQDDISDTWSKCGKYSSLSEKTFCWLSLFLSSCPFQVTESYLHNAIGTVWSCTCRRSSRLPRGADTEEVLPPLMSERHLLQMYGSSKGRKLQKSTPVLKWELSCM